MNIKLIAVDLDGTLLNSKKEMPDGFFRTVEALHAKNIRMVIASGRQYFNLKKLFAPIQDKLFFLCENGALIFDGEKNILCHAIPDGKLAAPFHAASEIPTATVVLCGTKSAYLRQPDPVAGQNVKLYYENRTVTEEPLKTALAADSIVKIAVFDRENVAQSCEPILHKFDQDLKLTLAGKNWLDFMRKDVNKGVSIGFLQRHLGLTAENCMAFGDYMNDFEMLQQVFYSYAMKNGHPDLVASARFTAPSNEENGVMCVLKEYFGDCVP